GKLPEEGRLGSEDEQDMECAVHLLPRDKGRHGLLQPGEEQDYILQSGLFDEVALVATTLPCTHYWIAAYCGFEELGRVAGEHLQPYLGRTGITFHRRAMPLFDTLPAVDRFAVLKAAASLRGRERDQWPSAGAQPLEG